MKALLIFLGVACLVFIAHATRQASDPLLWNGETVYPERGPTIINAFPKDQYPAFDPDSTANWKGYRATWEIKDDVLYLTSLNGSIKGKKVGLPELFPKQEPPIQAKWFSDVIIIPKGKELGLGKGMYRHVYEREQHLTVEQGKITKQEMKTFDRKKTKIW